ncbi:Nucleoid occlusion protein [Streptomyces sp. RB5]|uniref:Nucleoid occlusion protein n=1 Tax=Streptomyces smaragdinus TaxID=2585196 RepID=A0A7K0CNZ0_9ACTN|nr:ParB/RepB/Spo0J family partition protein [Streptomyces smaragdinus]MQY15169.1 Nucleoid occlusion protein [Streptomyces smaragdinus]
MSKKSELLGKSASFARAQPVSSRRAAIAAATGVPTQGVEPPSRIKRTQLAHNPFNVREALTDLEETAASLREKGQLQPLAVVTRQAFLAVHPGQEEVIGSALYVVIDGNRRLAASGLADLDEMLIFVNDDLAVSSADIVESALIANIHRVDVPPIDQAKAVQELLEKHKTQATVARRLGKTEAWVSQRLALLNLTPELQEKVETGELKVKSARTIGRMPREKQEAAAQEALNRVKAPRKPRSAAAPQTDPTPSADLPDAVAEVSVPGQPTDSSETPSPRLNPVKAAEGGSAPLTEEALAALPWGDPSWFADQLKTRMGIEDRAKLAFLLHEAQ